MEIPGRPTRLLILVSLILGFCLVVASVYYKHSSALSSDELTIQRAVASERHVYGDPSAPVKLVEFSDYQCPYCAKLHPNLKRLVDNSKGQISWEYRHLPLPNHSLAQPTAIVLECVAKELGEEAFWMFTDTIYENQDRLSAEFLKNITVKLGLTEAQLTACKSDTTIVDLINTDIKTATVLGGSGTPFTVILYPDDTYKTITGANKYEEWVALTEKYVK